jgi:hypothetical protein
MPGGVTYLKISKIDKDGIDRSEFIRQLQTLRVIYDADTTVEYKIRNVQPQSDSYWCAVSPISQSSNLGDYSVLNYNLEIDIGSGGYSKTINGARFYTASYASATHNDLNYFNTSTGVYTLGSLPNPKLFVSTNEVTIDYPDGSPPANTTARFCLIGSASFAAGNTSSIVCSAPRPLGDDNNDEAFDFIFDYTSPLFQKGQKMIPVIVINGVTPDTFTWDGKFEIAMRNEINGNVDPSTVGDSRLTLFEPDGANWDYNDFNPLFNNAEESRLSIQFLDVDYESGLTTPLNFIPIISGTAVHASVQDSNYASKAWSNLRYNGVRSNSPGFNQNLDLGGFGSIPNVEQNQTFFAYFETVQNTNPIIKDQTSYNIKYLIDSIGEVYQPAPLTPALYNLIDSFETNKKATIKTISNSGSNFSFLSDTHPITNVGRLDLILVSETGSERNDFIPTMSFDFGVLESSTANYTFFATATSSLEKPSGSTEAFISFSNAIYNTAGPNYSTATNSYTFTIPGITTAATGSRVKFNANILLYSNGNPQFKIQFIKNNSDVIAETVEAAWSTLTAPQLVPAFNEIGGVFQPFKHRLVTFSTPFLDFNTSDNVKVKIINLNPNYRIATRAGSSFSLTQEYSPSARNITGSVSTPYWSTGSNSGGVTILTASSGLTSVYNIGYKQSTPPSSSVFGFPNINTEFNALRVGDKIRFEYLEEKKYNISEIIPDGPSGRLCLKLDGVIPAGTQMNHFILYRVVNDGSSIILDINKTTPGEEFTGIIQPQYISSEVSNNYNQIIQSLTEKGLIA